MSEQRTPEKQISELLAATLRHSAIAELRFNTVDTDSDDLPGLLTKDLDSLVRHIVFLYRLGYLPNLYASPKRFLKAVILHYTVTDNPSDNNGWKRQVLRAIDSIEPDVIQQLRQDVPGELFIWYWLALDNLRDGSGDGFFSSTIEHFNRERLEASHAKAKLSRKHSSTPAVIVPPTSGRGHSYDGYLRDLSMRLYQNSEYYDLILIDSNNVNEYRSKGAIESFGLILHSHRTTTERLPQHLRIGQTINGVLEALPVTRNFHLPAIHKRFLDNDLNHAEHAKPVRDAVNTFMSKGKLTGDANLLIANEVSLAMYLQLITGKWHDGANDLAPTILRDRLPRLTAFSTGRFFTNQPIQQTTTLAPFSLGLGAGFNLIPMQLARGAHASYTFMAYTANLPQKKDVDDHRHSFISIRKPQKKQPKKNSEGETARTVYMFSAETLQGRLAKLMKLIFNFVPDASLCLEHHLSAHVRGLEPMMRHWFDPCLPIEAISFQDDEIYALARPAGFSTNEILTCFGGFCIAISEKSQDPFNVARTAVELATSLATKADQEKLSSEEPPDANGRIRLMPHHLIVTPDDLKTLTRDNSDLPRTQPPDRRAVAGILSPKTGAVRPNFDLWPHIESEISDAFRLYVTALFIYRAIQCEIVELAAESQLIRNSALFRRVQDARTTMLGAGEHSTIMNPEQILGFAENQKAGERLAIDALQSADIKRYLTNLQNIVLVLVENVGSDGKVDAPSLVKSNISSLAADADYLLGILRDCSDRIDESRLVNADLKPIGIRSVKAAQHFLALRDQMIDQLSRSLARTIREKIESYCQNLGWIVENSDA